MLLINLLSILSSAFESLPDPSYQYVNLPSLFPPHPKEEETVNNSTEFYSPPFLSLHLQSPKSSLSLWIFPPFLQSWLLPAAPTYSNESSAVISMLLRPGDTFSSLDVLNVTYPHFLKPCLFPPVPLMPTPPSSPTATLLLNLSLGLLCRLPHTPVTLPPPPATLEYQFS